MRVAPKRAAVDSKCFGQTNSRKTYKPCRVQAAAVTPNIETATKVRLKTKSDCELGVSVYPLFRYNAIGGGGWGSIQKVTNNTYKVVIDTDNLVIPDLSFKTASMFGIPIPPPLNIAIQPVRLEGLLNTETGEVNLEFDANFFFTAGSLYKAPALVVKTLLTTETVKGQQKGATGQRLVQNAGTLVGIATVPKCDDVFMDNFLLLPNDALAVMKSEFEFAP